MKIVGIMSGTSLDGVDFVLIEKKSQKIKYKDMGSVSFTKKMKLDLWNLAEGKMSFREAQLVHFRLGKFYAQSLKKIKVQKKWSFNLIGLHGQTVFHQAPQATIQIGEPSFLKEEFDVPVVSDFRSKILSVGGQGAPLAPILHNEIMSDHDSWGFLNIGGMSNLTFKSKKKLHATDLGPGNVFLDAAAKQLLSKSFDKGGMVAQRGIPDLKIVKKYLDGNVFIKKKAPKSCGREEFSDKEFQVLIKKMKHLCPEDALATFAEITLRPIVSEVNKNKLEVLVVSGGGALNRHLIKRLEESCRDTEVITSEDIGWPVQAVEGGAFALLAAYKASNVSSDLSYMGIKKVLSPLGRVD